MGRVEALTVLQEPMLTAEKMKDLEEYVMKKFELSAEEYHKILTSPAISYSNYPNQSWLINFYHNFVKRNED